MKRATSIPTRCVYSFRRPLRRADRQLLRWLDQVLRDAVAEGPVAQRVFDQIDDHVFAADADALLEAIGDELEECLLDLVGAPDAEKVPIDEQRLRLVLGDDMKAIALGCFEDPDDRLVDDI